MTWGYRHFAGRWAGAAERFHSDIAGTFASGRRRRMDRGTVRYDRAWVGDSGEIERAMTVVVSLRAQQPDVGIRGIITAYWWSRPERASVLVPGRR